MSNNPLYDRLTRNARGPSLRLCLWLAVGLAVIMLATSIWDMLRVPRTGEFLLWPLGMAGWAVSVITPGIVGALAVLSSARDQATEEYQLLRLTPLSEKTIIWGYLLAALYRARIFLGLVVGLMPAAVLWPAATIEGSTSSSEGLLRVQPDLVGTSLLFLAIVLGLWVINPLAAAQGTTVGFRARSAPQAAVLVGIEMIVIPGIVLVAMLTLLGPVIGSQIPELLRRAALLSAGVCIVLPCLITVGVIAWAQRRVRRDRGRVSPH